MPDTQAEKTQSPQSLREQRDRFLAFAFASADLFIEISEEGKITHMLGAARGITGAEQKTLIGRKWLELFSVYEQSRMIHAFENAKAGMRCGPMLINLSETMGARKSILTGIKMPGSNKIYLTLGLSNAIMARVAHAMAESSGMTLLTRDDFIESVQKAFARTRTSGQEIALSFMDFAPTAMDRKRMGETAWKKMRELLGEFLVTESFDGYTAGEMGDGRYAFLHDAKIKGETFREKISALIKQSDPGGQGVAVKSKTLTANLKTMPESECARAARFTIDEFTRKGADLPYNTLNAALEAFGAANAPKLKEFHAILERSGFALHFQPIIDFKTNEPRGYEMLCRFDTGVTRDWINFAVEMNAAADFDLAVCERAINHIKFKAGNTYIRFTVNLLSQSIENIDFQEKLMAKLTKAGGLADRLVFEISDPASLVNLDIAGRFVETLRALNYGVILDDVRDTEPMMERVRKLNPSGIKIDARHVRDMIIFEREGTSVRTLIETAHELGMEAYAKGVEDRPQADALRALGADGVQGHYFGKPSVRTEYAAPRD